MKMLWGFGLAVVMGMPIGSRGTDGRLKLEVITLEVYTVGAPVTVNVRINNTSGRDVLLARAQDGSLHRYRYPHLYFEITDRSGRSVKMLQPTDKVVNPLSPAAFFILAADAAEDFFEDGLQLDRYYDLGEGTYTVTCFYATDAAKESQWYGAYADEFWDKKYENSFWLQRRADIEACSKLIGKVPPVRLASPPAQITIGRGGLISREQAIEIAKRACRQRQWKWDESRLLVWDQGAEWRVVTNANSLGMNAIIQIDKKTGEVTSQFLTGP